jgi:predicted permease
MLDTFVRVSVSKRRREGGPGLARWWLAAAADLARTVVVEWWDAGVGSGEAVAEEGRMGATGRGKAWGGEGLGMEVRVAIRRYARRPVWTAAALTTLFVGVGATTGVVSLVHESLIRPLPFERPERLFEITAVPVEGGSVRRFSLDLLETWQVEQPGDLPVAGWASTRTPMDLGQGPEYLDAGFAAGDLMALLGVRALVGRAFSSADGYEGAPPVVALTEELWRTHFGADPSLVGRTVQIGSREHTVVGIVGDELATLLPEARLWLSTSTFPRSPYITVFRAVGRLSDGVGAPIIEERLAAVRVADSAGTTFSGAAEPLHDVLVRDARPVLLTFLALVAGLLLIGGVNLANLLLGRAVAAEGDRTIRVALGASRARLVRGALVDGLLLGTVGGIGGLLGGLWVRRLVLASAPTPIPAVGSGGWGVEAAAALGLATVLCAGLSVWTASGVSAAFRPGSQGAAAAPAGRSLRRVQRTLTVAQVAASFVLLVGSTLLVRTFVRLSSVDPGYETRAVGVMALSIPTARYPDAATQEAFARRLVEELRAMPGVEAAAAVDRPPLRALAQSPIRVEGADSTQAARMSAVIEAEPAFFEVMGIPLLRGRGLDAAGPPGTDPVAVVSETFARRFFPDVDPIGKRFRRGEGPWRTIVGVSGDVLVAGPVQDVEPVLFESLDQTGAWSNFVSVVFASPAGAARVLPAVRERLRALEPAAPVLELASYDQVLRASPGVAEARFRALIVGLLGIVALVLSAVGVYGVTAYTVRLRARELGIRMALGSGGSRTLSVVLGEGLYLALAGVLIGGAVAWATVDRLSGFLAGQAARDPSVFGGVGALLVLVVLAASIKPAWAAARVAPADVLRDG